MPFGNSGETHYRLIGQVLIKDAAGKTIETIDMDSSPIHTHTSVNIGLPIQALPTGEYTMSLQLKFGSKILVKEAIVEVRIPLAKRNASFFGVSRYGSFNIYL